MGDALLWHRLQFAFTIVYHYLFPQLTMGLALFIVVFEGIALCRNDETYRDLARFWTRIFGLNFAVGVVTGLPMEFQFGTNWARFSHVAGGVIGQSLAMESLFAFFLESTFLGLLVWGAKKLSPRAHFLCAVALLVGSWSSGFFIVTTNAFMQHPVGYTKMADGTLALSSLTGFVFNPWGLIEWVHTIDAAVVTGSFVVCAIGAYWTLKRAHARHARVCLKVGTTVGLVAAFVVAFPTGDQQAKLVAKHQPVALAAMEGRFQSGPRADITLIGQPDVPEKRLDNPIKVPGALSFLAYGTFHSDVAGLDAFPQDQWPGNIELLYYSFHVMAGLGTLMIGLMALARLLVFRKRLERTRPVLWALMLAFPFPYIANTAGWLTAELGRQPWLIYEVLRTRDGSSPTVHSGDALFTLIGFCGLYLLLGLLFVFLVGKEIGHGPEPRAPGGAPPSPAEATGG